MTVGPIHAHIWLYIEVPVSTGRTQRDAAKNHLPAFQVNAGGSLGRAWDRDAAPQLESFAGAFWRNPRRTMWCGYGGNTKENIGNIDFLQKNEA